MRWFLRGTFLDRSVKLVGILTLVFSLFFLSYYLYDRYTILNQPSRKLIPPEEEEYEGKLTDPNDIIRKGLFYLERRQFNQSIREFKKVIEVDPKNSLALVYLAYANFYKGDFKEALKWCNKEIAYAEAQKEAQSNIALEKARFLSGAIFLELKRYDEAIERLKESLLTNPSSADTYLYIGRAHLGKKNYNEALKNIETSLKFDPAYSLAYYYRGLTLEKKERYFEAMKDYEKALSLDKGFKLAKEGLKRVKERLSQ